MKEKIRWITRTAAALALLAALQAATKGFGQFVTGSCVNAVLAVSVMLGGMSSGVTVALCSPILAFLLGIAPQALTVPAIMAGNTVFVVLLRLITHDGGNVRKIIGWLVAAVCKFLTLYALVAWVICGVAADALLASGALKEPMLAALPVTFGLTQLVTALIGGGVGLTIAVPVRKALNHETL